MATQTGRAETVVGLGKMAEIAQLLVEVPETQRWLTPAQRRQVAAMHLRAKTIGQAVAVRQRPYDK